jgi:hypothetical protein
MVLTQHGRAVAVVVSIDDLRELEAAEDAGTEVIATATLLLLPAVFIGCEKPEQLLRNWRHQCGVSGGYRCQALVDVPEQVPQCTGRCHGPLCGGANPIFAGE